MEYVIILTAIIAVVIAFAVGVLKPKVQTSLENVANQMGNETNKIKF
jgi:Flp pilus assembly pilin Flp